MALKIAFQMDPIDQIDVFADTTFRLIEESQKDTSIMCIQSLKYDNGEVKVLGLLWRKEI